MAKLKKHRKWIVLAVVLLLVLLWYFAWPRPLLKDPANMTLFSGNSVSYRDGHDFIALSEGTDFELEELQAILADCKISRKFDWNMIRKFTGSIVSKPLFDVFQIQLSDGNGATHLFCLGEGGNEITNADGYWEVENHDEIYTRLMDLFAGKLTV